jgi:glutamate/tyrosine decarboxylase-like PLP-dependent enzyme
VAVVGNAGTVSTGAIDPLPAMAEVCAQHKVWFHVDGATETANVMFQGVVGHTDYDLIAEPI